MEGTDRISHSDRILMGLGTLLLNGEFPARMRLPETALAEWLGISRITLREAMARLSAIGIDAIIK